MEKVKVFIMGYGTIGKRVADAVSKQPDMEVIGVSKRTPDVFATLAARHGYQLYTNKENVEKFKEKGIHARPVEDGLEEADVIIDATPKGVGALNKQTYYSKLDKRVIFEGGEKPDVAEVSFVAQVNYEKAKGKKHIRVVSCNTTGLARALHSLKEFSEEKGFKIKEAHATLIRRAVDPHDVKKGPINAIVPELEIPSHHAPDLLTVMNGIPITTVAIKVPTTLMHVHSIQAKIEGNGFDREEFIQHLERTPRIYMVSKSEGLSSTASIIEFARDFGRKRYDLYELVVWKDSITFRNGWVHWIQGVHQEAIVVPENVDAIRASLGLMEKEESIKLTDKTLGIVSQHN
ncbi:MAG: type II glyceraldehyde-3-phosphate dehydrogenase [Candidatus Aenigmarchaeota archaeon]|nr:type II glyceraldehyde-3-phosphate dehydrogenase [Candidatus Aenigmarchaeota archaeon]